MSSSNKLLLAALSDRITLLRDLAASPVLPKTVPFYKKQRISTNLTELVRVLNLGISGRAPTQFVSYSLFFVALLSLVLKAGFIEGYKILTFPITLYQARLKAPLIKIIFKVSSNGVTPAVRGVHLVSTRNRLVSISFTALLSLLRVQRQPSLYVVSTSTLGLCTQDDLLAARRGGIIICTVR